MITKPHTKPLKLYVWEGVLKDWYPGMMVALAPDLKTARRLIEQKEQREAPYSLDRLRVDLNRQPSVHTTPWAGVVWGGG